MTERERREVISYLNEAIVSLQEASTSARHGQPEEAQAYDRQAARAAREALSMIAG